MRLNTEMSDSESLEIAVRQLDEKITKVMVQQAEIVVQVVEIKESNGKRVSTDAFTGAMNGINDRIARLETAPQKNLGWIALFVSGGVGCLSVLVTVIGIVVSIWIAHR